MVVPPAADGSVNPYTLAAAAEAGVDEIYKVGGAQAVAALAYGTATIPRVDKIVGPGNAYVTAAKKLVMGDVGIDMLAGPSEVLILADETAVPAFVAIDLMAQAEHDPRAATYLVTTDPELPDLVEEALEILLDESPRGDITARSLTDNGIIIICPDIVAALDTVRSHRTRAPRGDDVASRSICSAASATRARSSWGHGRLRAWATTSPGRTTCCPPAEPHASSSPLSVDDFVKKS